MSIAQVQKVSSGVTYLIDRQNFDTVVFDMPGTLSISIGQATANALSVFAARDILDMLTVCFNERCLVLSSTVSFEVAPQDRPQCYLAVSSLKELTVSKTGRISFQQLQTPFIHFEVKDDALVRVLNGRIEHLSLTLTERGCYQGLTITNNVASVIMRDQARAYMKTPDDDLEITASDRSKCYYDGLNPHCTNSKIKGLAELIRYIPI